LCVVAIRDLRSLADRLGGKPAIARPALAPAS
jgi:hypothetical protein